MVQSALNIQEKATILQVKGLDMPKADDDTSSYSTSEKWDYINVINW